MSSTLLTLYFLIARVIWIHGIMLLHISYHTRETIILPPLQQTLQQRLRAFLEGYVVSRYYPLMTGGVAFACALGFVPFVPVLIIAVLLSPRQWWLIGIFTSLGSAAGGVVLMLLFHHIGWVQVMNAHPEWFEGDTWHLMISWLIDYGVWALAVIGATPFPQSPALLFLAMIEQSWWSIWLALAGGKLLKYGTVAYLVRYFPAKLTWLKR